jgi:hypothetical protein
MDSLEHTRRLFMFLGFLLHDNYNGLKSKSKPALLLIF